jgi:hypothetical protein
MDVGSVVQSVSWLRWGVGEGNGGGVGVVTVGVAVAVGEAVARPHPLNNSPKIPSHPNHRQRCI